MKKFFRSLVAVLLVPFLLFAILTRIALSIYAYHNDQIYVSALYNESIFLHGLLNDLVTFIYCAAPLVLLTRFTTSIVKSSRVLKWLGMSVYFVWILVLCFNSFAEIIFWEEFGSRYNFIAVDYLVYTQEVVGNIFESYPMTKLLLAITAISLVVFAILYRYLNRYIKHDSKYSKLLESSGLCLAMILLFFCYTGEYASKEYQNRYESELSKNGIYNLFSAFRNNVLDYEQFYANLPISDAFALVKKELKATNSHPYDISRTVAYAGKPRSYNVILLSVESLSAEFMGRFGNNQDWTPYLNQLAKKSLFFSHYYAVGTRTVRGLEAMTLSLPPTPGNSIVRRPGNEHLFSIGSVLKQNGYDRKFIYGGYGYFDNMNAFFTGNGFTAIDRSDMAEHNVQFSNAWGVCDEDLFTQTIREADQSHAMGKPFFSLVMTTSNHRPFTYPEGKIDIKPGTGRHGAVKYTDYAIGQFLEAASKKPWFANTIFVITADHCAASAGKTEVPVDKYHIPLLVYAPALVKPQEIHKLSSQIDLAPTILGLLNISYESRFFGEDILTSKKSRAFLGTYQQLGLFEDQQLIVLSPKSEVDSFMVKNYHDLSPISIEQSLLSKAISYYQVASYLFKHGLLKETK